MSKALSEMNWLERTEAEIKEILDSWELHALGVITDKAYEIQQQVIKEKYAPYNGEAYEDEHGNLIDTPSQLYSLYSF